MRLWPLSCSLTQSQTFFSKGNIMSFHIPSQHRPFAPVLPKGDTLTSHNQSPVARKPRVTPFARLATALLFALALLPFLSASAGGQVVPSNPRIFQAVTIPQSAEYLVLHGDGFTPGGLVQVTASFCQDASAERSFWVVASNGEYGPASPADPSRGYLAAGTVNEVLKLHQDGFWGANGSQDPANGYVPALELQPEDVYGPNGSQDPAQGYVDSGHQIDILELGCSQDLSVRAFDASTAAWSNTVMVVAA
jgi:hypothetical protein